MHTVTQSLYNFKLELVPQDKSDLFSRPARK